MDYNINTIKKRVGHLFINPSQDCYYFYSVGVTNLKLTTYNEFIHDQSQILFKILNKYENVNKLKYAVFAGNSVGLVRNGKNLPWGDDYDVILFQNYISFFSNVVIPEIERYGFKIQEKIINNIVCGVKIFGPPIVFGDHDDGHDGTDNIVSGVSKDVSINVFQCDIFYSHFDKNKYLKNRGGWGLYHEKNIPYDVVFPLKRRMFHGTSLPFFNNPRKEVELCYVDVNKCSIFSHHLDSTIFYKRWENAYKDFDCIKKTSISNTRNYIMGLGKDQAKIMRHVYIPSNDLALTHLNVTETDELRNIILNKNDNSYIIKKLQILCYLYNNNIGKIIITPLNFPNNDFENLKKENSKIYNIYNTDYDEYDYNSIGLKFIGEHAIDIKYYFPQIKIIYDESQDKNEDDSIFYFISPLSYKYVDIIRVTRSRYEKVYLTKFINAKKYKTEIPILEIIENVNNENVIEKSN